MNMESKLNGLSRKLGCDAELFSSDTARNTFSTEREALKYKKTALTRGHALRVIKQRRMGFAYFERESDLDKAFKRALKLSKSCEPGDYRFSQERGSSARFASRRSFGEREAVESLEEMASAVEGAADSVGHVLSTASTKLGVLTPEGSVTQRFTQFYVSSECAKGTSDGADSESSSTVDFSPQEVALNAANYARVMSSAGKTSPGEQAIVFDVRALQDFLHLFMGFNFSGESLRKRVTRLKPGLKLGNEGLSIEDDPLLERGLNSAQYDDEGFRTERRALVERGVVQGFVFDMPTAAKAGKQGLRARPGNGWRGSFKSQPLPGFSNLAVSQGDVKDLVSECKRGVYVVSFLAMGANPVTGDFSLPLQTAIEIRKGELRDGVRGATLVGNFFEAMKGVEFEKKRRKHHDMLLPRAGFKARVVA